jgi:transposase
MARQYKSYDEDFKKTIVNLYENGKGISELSREYGIGKSTIDGWIKKFKTITTSTGEVTNNDEILKLQKKNRELEQEVEILKKAVAIFSKK